MIKLDVHSVKGHLEGVVRAARHRLPGGSPETAPDSSLPFQAKRPTVNPILPTSDIDASIDFYRELGFEVVSYDSGYAWVRSCSWEYLHLRRVDELDPAANEASAYVHVADPDAWRTAFVTAAPSVAVGDVADMPWGMREFALTDPSGNLIRFGCHR